MNKQSSSPPANGRTPDLRLLALLAGSFVFLLLDGIYLLLDEVFEVFRWATIENATYQYVFAAHLVVGIFFTLLFAAFVPLHLQHIRLRRNDNARQRGLVLAGISLVLIVSGVALLRVPAVEAILNNQLRLVVYLLHVLLPAAALLAYRFHRRAGRQRLDTGSRRSVLTSMTAGVAALFALIVTSGAISMRQDTTEVAEYFPSLLKAANFEGRTSNSLMQDGYCQQCHQDVHARWEVSAHRNSSFNNPFYAASVKRTRDVVLARDGDVSASRFCAGCHDPVPLILGEFDQLDFDAPAYASASAGLNCTVCHSITSIDSPRGNADFTMTAPQHYPLAFSSSESLRWFSNLLVKSNPDFHKRTFLKPLHRTPEFCGSCHKVHIPEELNKYRWLRGQNHYDSFQQSGVSGQRIDSFFYPPRAETNCNGCHMGELESNDLGAKIRGLGAPRTIRDHLFASGNTALPFVLAENSVPVIDEHREFLSDSVTLDIVGFRAGGRVDGPFIPAVDFANTSQPGESYLAELVVRTRKLGHAFTEGTTDSNQVWIAVQLLAGDDVIASSGDLDSSARLDPGNVHQVRNYVVDRNGKRIGLRNVEDIYTAVYRHQIPPGAADVLHYRFTVPDEAGAALQLEAQLLYRKFDSDFLHFSLPETAGGNELPIIAMTSATVALSSPGSRDADPAPDLNRLNDYGIGLLRKPNRSQFRQAESVFRQLAEAGHAAGSLNLARLLIADGRIDDAADLLTGMDPGALDNPWTAVWLTALIDLQNGYIGEAIDKMRALIADPPGRARESGFDFGGDYQLLQTLGGALLAKSRIKSLSEIEREQTLGEAKAVYERLLQFDPENVPAHQGMMRVATILGDGELAEMHRSAHQLYKGDETAESLAASRARELDADLDKLAGDVVIYELRPVQ